MAEDDRGFTTAGIGHVPPEFNPPSPAAAGKKTRSSSKLRPFPIIQVPLSSSSVSPEDLDLDSTIKAGQSFGSSSGSQDREAGLQESSSHYENSTYGDNTTSYAMAVNRGRFDSVAMGYGGSQLQPRGRKQTMLQKLSVMSRLRSASTASTIEEEFDSRSLTSVKALKKELGRPDFKNTSELLFLIMDKKHSKDSKKAKLLAALLTYGDVNVNERAPGTGMTAIHYAVREYDYPSLRVLVSFGANINATNHEGETPMDMLHSNIADMETATGSLAPYDSTPSSPEHSPVKGKAASARQLKMQNRVKCIDLLKSIGGLGHEFASRTMTCVEPFPQVPSSSPALTKKSYAEVLDWEAQITSHFSDLERNIHSRLQNTSMAGQSAVFSPDTAISLAVQLQEMTLFQKAGSRVLCLDGGGIRGLIQLEILSQLEIKTGRKVTELFDWIVGTSTGGIIALGLVYAKKSLTQLRQLYFRMKDEVFKKVKGSMSYNTTALEAVLKKEFTETRCMDDETYPRVLISAVKKDHINLKLHFFNNCFNDEHHKHWPVWKVARYTCAAPVLFGESDEYVDGGVLANNPSDSALTRIQSFYRSRNEKFPLSLVVSVGCGKYPMQQLGNVDFLFIGSQGFSSLSGTSNLMALLSYALVEPSVADDNCRSRCEEQAVRYYRLNPRLEEVIESGETDMETLVATILQTRKEMESRQEFSNLVLCLHELSDASRKMHSRLNGEPDSSSSSSSIT